MSELTLTYLQSFIIKDTSSMLFRVLRNYFFVIVYLLTISQYSVITDLNLRYITAYVVAKHVFNNDSMCFAVIITVCKGLRSCHCFTLMADTCLYA